MHPPPSSAIIQRLAGASVESVCFGKFTAHISCENGMRLSFEAPFKFGRADVLSDGETTEFPVTESGLMRVVGCQISEAACEADGTLSLTFTNGDALVVYANDPMYEAYTLLVDGREYVV